MLSAHEIAALLILGSRGSPAGLDPGDVDALAHRSLIEVHAHSPAGGVVQLTREGRLVVAAMSEPARSARRSAPFRPGREVPRHGLERHSAQGTALRP